MRERSLPAVPASGAAGEGIRVRDEGAVTQAPVCRLQGDHGRGSGTSAGPPVHLAAARRVQRSLPGCPHHQQLPAHPGVSMVPLVAFALPWCLFVAVFTLTLVRICQVPLWKVIALHSQVIQDQTRFT